VYLFLVQSFYKALLFFSAGAARKAGGKEELGGFSVIRDSHIAYVSAAFGTLALAGFIPFCGFFSNLSIGAAFSTNLVAYAFITVIELCTSFYIFRWFLLQTKKAPGIAVPSGRTQPRSMSFGMVALAIATLLAGIGVFFIPSLIGASSQSLVLGGLVSAWSYAIIETGAVAAGALVSYAVYRRKKGRQTRRTLVLSLSAAINSAYAYAAAFVGILADGVAHFDTSLDSALSLLGRALARIGKISGKASAGEMNNYVIIFAVGLLLLHAAVAIV
jgi:NADH:ubiquinone oxidoreductase subunit 5 (subunit L)/multisubunit Na+/H+ antiporter MnhA subunit